MSELASASDVWTTGFELELLAPIGASRRTLAEAIADRHGGTVRRIFHMESEPSAVPGQPVFHNLTIGFEAVDDDGRLIARCVDDLTLQHDLDRRAAPKRGWFRLVSDDPRLLSLARQHIVSDDTLESATAVVAALFGTTPQPGAGGMLRVVDDLGSSVLIGAPLPGERERPCELVTPPLGADRRERLTDLLAVVHDLGFSIPREAALHIHFDAKRLRDARVFARLVRCFANHGPALSELLGRNPHWRRVGRWPDALVATATAPDFASLSWPEAAERLKATELTKFCDFNVLNIVLAPPEKDTFEVRMLPVTLDASRLSAIADLFESILRALVADTLPDCDSTSLLKAFSLQ